MTDINLYNDETIAKFEKEISNACSCIIKNPVKNLYENIETIRLKLQKVNTSCWEDSVVSCFLSGKEQCLKELKAIEDSLSTLFQKSEDTYKQIKEELKNYKETRRELVLSSYREPSRSDYYVNGVLNESAYRKDYAEWDEYSWGLSDKCDALELAIKNLLHVLDYINASSIDNPNQAIIKSLNVAEATSNEFLSIVSKLECYEYIDTSKLVLLEGEERDNFIARNYLRDSESLNIEKYTLTINGVEFESYFIYDTNDEKFNRNLLLEESDKRIEYMTMIPGDILEQINSTQLLFKASNDIDIEFSKVHYSAYYREMLDTISICPCQSGNKASIIHEFGHSYDAHQVGLIYLEQDNIDVKEQEDWYWLAYSQSEDFKNTFPNVSSYQVSDYMETEPEFFADCFCQYFLHPEERERFSQLCPPTYARLLASLGYDSPNLEAYRIKYGYYECMKG